MRRMHSGLTLLLAVFALSSSCRLLLPRPNLNAYDVLREPRITERPNEKVLQATLKGDPDKTAALAIEAVMRGFYSIGEVNKFEFHAPKARWLGDEKTAREDWVGVFAMTVPATVSKAPKSPTPEVELVLANWEYGKVAEMLHQGDYNSTLQTASKLKAFIAQWGYEVVGDHEEEYILGPGSPGEKGPSSWITVVRYRIKKSTP